MEAIELGLDKDIIQSGTIDQRINALISLDSKNGDFFWEIISEMLLYCANRIPEISDTTENVDDAMKWGFGWEIGPFEIWDMIGFLSSVTRMQSDNKTIPEWIGEMISKGGQGFYLNKH